MTLLVLSFAAVNCDVERDNPNDEDAEQTATTDTGDGPGSEAGGSSETTGEGESSGDDGESSGAGTTGVAEPAVESCDEMNASRACQIDGGGGQQYCGLIAWQKTWGPCLAEVTCELGEVVECDPWNGSYFNEECRLDRTGVPAWVEYGEECWTPLVLRFDAAPVELALADGHSFDISGMGACLSSDWPTAATPWLALDRDENGSIDDARELFGSAVVLASGRGARDGFAALAEHDADGDGRIGESDPVWSRLLLWSDHNADRRSTAWELEPLAGRGVTEIQLDVRVDRRCDERGNCEAERSAFNYRGSNGEQTVGEVIDLHLACQ